MRKFNEPSFLLLTGTLLLAITAIHPHDYTTWWMETAPIFIAVPIFIATYKSYTLTPLVYRLLFVHATILMVGGHYTYAEVPLGYWMEHWFGFVRNDYDKIGHFAQGFVPALLFRELLLRARRYAEANCCSHWWSPVASPSAPATNSSNGRRQSAWDKAQMLSWARRAIRGIHRRIC